MRIYLPLTLVELAEFATAARLDSPREAFALTPALRERYATGDTEELEYAAFGAAAAAALDRLAEDPRTPRRRVVLAADVAETDVRPVHDGAPAVVVLTRAVRRAQAASIHVDGPEAIADIAAAVAALKAARTGDADAQFVVDGAADHELQWFGVQEVDALVAGAGVDLCREPRFGPGALG